MSDVPSVNNLAGWLRSLYVPERQEHFNQVVANMYARQRGQNIPWHSDHNPLLADDDTHMFSQFWYGELAVFCAPHTWPPSPNWPPP